MMAEATVTFTERSRGPVRPGHPPLGRYPLISRRLGSLSRSSGAEASDGFVTRVSPRHSVRSRSEDRSVSELVRALTLGALSKLSTRRWLRNRECRFIFADCLDFSRALRKGSRKLEHGELHACHTRPVQCFA